jgi:hypothetical protein
MYFLYLFACSPKTGRRLRHGPALRERAKTVELPAVSALFADIASKRPTRPWDLNPNPGAVQGMPPPPLVGFSARILHCNTWCTCCTGGTVSLASVHMTLACTWWL